MKKIYEGKAKILYEAENNQIVQYFKDDTTAFNNEKFAINKNKGVVNNKISTYLMQKIEEEGVETHFIKQIDDRTQLIKKLQIIPLEVIVRNIAAGSFCKKFGCKKGTPLKTPLVEFSVKDDALGDPLIPASHIYALGIATEEDVSLLITKALQVNKVLQKQFGKIGVTLVDFKIEFGKNTAGEIILADEISPDSCRLWDKKTNESLDKDLFRESKGDLLAGYLQIAKRLGLE